ncbi:Acyl-CoA N-acyltransferases (NAT) superfamily protein [Thalictrum thalictroides]|uniref:Acyl-CoA N-acyltransferases (NAT) superfamily protein n=1 Tax=Thalictrum thalictroides TaxID=46969 RepID=A0A7J6USB6_THATH|nr:Acyl-CoA N-acyltransferases (NAT) superfamily protein [Thalictrum thalictroides]
MPTIIPLGLTASPYPTTTNTTTLSNTVTTTTAAATTFPSNPTTSPPYLKKSRNGDEHHQPQHSSRHSSLINSPKSGICKASQAVELFPPVCPGIVVREARLEDCWEVAETHCSSFFPDYSFPLDLALRIDRLVGLLSGFSVPNGCRRTCLVAVVNNSGEDKLFLGSEPLEVGTLEGNFGFNRGYVAGILTVDTVADFLPRKGPLRERRTGIAYVSNVAVRERDRCKGIAKRLVAKAEAQARSWGCRAIALHCDVNNPAATKLYKGQGFKSIKVPERAIWPQPKTAPNVQFSFMMKLLTSRTTS